MILIDTHTHLFVDAFDEDRSEMLARAREEGVSHFLLPNIDVESIDRLKNLIASETDCYGMMGLHPCSVKGNYKEALEVIRKELETGEYLAVGEIGIDLYWDKTFLKEQQEALRTQCEWAKELKLPIVIHARDSFDEIFEVIDEVNDESLRGVFHCFTGTEQQAKKILSYGGFKMGLGGVLTFKKSGLDQVVNQFPLEHFVLETDSPYLAPTPHRG
ncbi:MAG: TatD family hydrolase, partial [Flavobacteriales bacterium]